MGARMIMICLDGADGKMLDQYSIDGSLPNLTALRLKGAATLLSAPLGSTDDALWASFQYMLQVGEHGKITLQYRKPIIDSVWRMKQKQYQLFGMIFHVKVCKLPFWTFQNVAHHDH